MFMYQRFVPGLAIASNVIGDEKAKRSVVIDPMRDVDEYMRIAHAEGLHITHVWRITCTPTTLVAPPSLKRGWTVGCAS